VTLGYFALFGSLFLMSQLLQFVLGYSALGAGLRAVVAAAVAASWLPPRADETVIAETEVEERALIPA
jgi:hypothetical protein